MRTVGKVSTARAAAPKLPDPGFDQVHFPEECPALDNTRGPHFVRRGNWEDHPVNGTPLARRLRGLVGILEYPRVAMAGRKLGLGECSFSVNDIRCSQTILRPASRSRWPREDHARATGLP